MKSGLLKSLHRDVLLYVIGREDRLFQTEFEDDLDGTINKTRWEKKISIEVCVRNK